jgi:hypothetical protein
MKLSIIITESQKKTILTESIKSDFIESFKSQHNLFKKIVEDVKSQIGVNLEFMLTWGATIGGFISPISQYISGKHPELSEVDLSLILTGVVANYYFDNRKTISKLTEEIQNRGLSKIYLQTLKKSETLKKVFVDFISSLGLNLHKITNIMSYAFIIPVLPMIYNMVSSNDISEKELIEIVKRLGGFSFLTVSGILFRDLILKLSNRFRNS